VTGREHYQKAEALLDVSQRAERGSGQEVGLLAEAQVHATLALAAATSLGTGAPYGASARFRNGGDAA
jgi:hypothetical protein